jgi:hypothetical protein
MSTIDDLMNQFRLASRELFNHYFHGPDPYRYGPDPYKKDWHEIPATERFSEVERFLFEKMVLQSARLGRVEYGDVNKNIRVELRSPIGFVPISLNREINSGYWDYPIDKVAGNVEMAFIEFFDWSQVDYHDNRYVRVLVCRWPDHPEIDDKHGLIESQYVRFSIKAE